MGTGHATTSAIETLARRLAGVAAAGTRDAGFTVPELVEFCEAEGVRYAFG